MEAALVPSFDESEVRESYVDAASIESGFYGFTLTLGTFRRNQKPKAEVKIRMSPQMTKVITLLLTRAVKEYEKTNPIPLPTELAQSMGLERTEVI